MSIRETFMRLRFGYDTATVFDGTTNAKGAFGITANNNVTVFGLFMDLIRKPPSNAVMTKRRPVFLQIAKDRADAVGISHSGKIIFDRQSSRGHDRRV